MFGEAFDSIDLTWMHILIITIFLFFVFGVYEFQRYLEAKH